jgi:biopolymer transport protein ExbB/TolQ
MIAALALLAQQPGPSSAIGSWTPIVVAMISLLGVAYAAQQTSSVARRQRRIERLKVDGEAYERARAFDEARFTRMELDLQAARNENSELRERSLQQELIIAKLKLRLVQQGIDVEGGDP